MKKQLLFVAVMLLIFGTIRAQVTTNMGSGLAPTYPSLAAAITALNAATITSPVVITLTGNETTPQGGYIITATGTAVNTIIIEGSASTITAFTPQVSGTLHDAIFEIQGGDFITIRNFTMLENPANTTTDAATNNMTEFGVALFYATTTNGCQNITIHGNTIDLDRTYTNTFGIYSNSTHSATAMTGGPTATGPDGGNHNLVITANTITDVNQGIVVIGPTAAADQNTGMVIGGSVPNANTITNYGTAAQQTGYRYVSSTKNGTHFRNTNGYTISHNSITSSTGVTTGTVRGIFAMANFAAPAHTFTNNINNNNISVQAGGADVTLQGIIVQGTSSSTTSTININHNNFHAFGHIVTPASGAITFISNSGAHQHQSISNNTFTNIAVNTTGNVDFISNNNTLPSGGVKNVNNNAVVGAFSKTGAGDRVRFFFDSGSDPAGTLNNTNNNNFSNITVNGATILQGIVNTNSGSPTKSVSGNILNNWTAGTAAVTAISVNWGDATTAVTGNIISNINPTVAGTATTTAILMGADGTGTKNVWNNTIYNITVNTSVTVRGIVVDGPAGSTRNVFRNNIYNLSNIHGTGEINGILVESGTNIFVYNNFLSQLYTPSSTGIADRVRGINITSTTASSTVGLYYNTIYLDGSSTGTTFGSAGIYHTSSATATTAALDMRNNIIVNNTTPSGTGRAVAFRRSTVTPANYSTVSNNNAFFAGVPGPYNLIYFDGTNSDQTIEAFRSRIYPRESVSFTENIDFMNITVSPYDLRLDPTTPTRCESGAQRITMPIAITNDFFGTIRAMETGYTGTGNAPDVGAHEGQFIDLFPPVISYTPLPNTSLLTSRTLVVSITDGGGVPASAPGWPHLYWRIGTSGAWTAAPPISVAGSNYTFSFGAGVVAGNVVQYFVVAQDMAPIPNVGAHPAAGAGGFSINPPAAATPPTTPSSYTIVAGLEGTFTVGTTGNYPSLTGVGGLFADINARVLTGNMIADIISDLSETGANALNQWAEDGTGNYTLTIRPSDAVVRTISGSYAGGLIRLNGADWVRIDGRFGGSGHFLTIRNTSTFDNTAAIQIISLGAGAGATHNTIRNCNIAAGSISNTTFGIFAGGPSISTTGTGAHNNHLLITNNVITRAYYAIFARGVAATGLLTGLDIRFNTIGSATSADYVRFRGVDIQNATAPLIAWNTIFNLIHATAVNNAGIDLGANVNDAVVNGNLIRGIHSLSPSGRGAYGINISSTTTNNITLSNNAISDIRTVNYDTTATARNAFGIRIAGGANHKIYYNSVNLFGSVTGGTTAGMSANMVITAASPGLDVRNNIFVNTQTFAVAGSFAYNVFLAGGVSFATINYNNYFGTSGTNTTYRVGWGGGAARTALPDWRMFTGQDVNSLAVNPQFAGATNLQPIGGSPVLGAGTPITGVTTDLTGALRHATTPSIGAYEHFYGTPLPIELLYFTASARPDRVVLTWATASETNNDFFTIERSLDASRWEDLTQVDGAGNSAQTLRYRVYDHNPSIGISYYRLKQTDYDGAYSYSPISAVRFEGTENPVSIFPNPARDILYISTRESSFRIHITNTFGQMVLAGYSQTELDISQLVAGVYSVRIVFPDGTTHMSRLVVNR